MSLSVTVKTRSFSGGSSTTATTSSITPTADTLQTATLWYYRASGVAEVPTCTGNGLTWVVVKNLILDGDASAVVTFAAIGSSPSSGAVTFTFSNAHQEYLWEVLEWSGSPLNPSDPYGNVAFVNTVGPHDSGSPLTVTGSAFANSDNRPYMVAANASTMGLSVEAGWTNLHGDFWAHISGRSAWQSSAPDNSCTFWQNSNIDSTGLGGYAFEIGDLSGGGGSGGEHSYVF